MRIVRAWPPNIADIVRALPGATEPGVIFCYGDRIYAPHGGKLPRRLIAHEEVHSRQQGSDPEGWWRRYLDDPKFRLDQELPAHRAEYGAFCAAEGDKNLRFRFLVELAQRISGPVYGSMVEFHEAKSVIRSDQ